MPKVKISEWSSTPANNTDIDGINIAEGCAPSGINDALREIMAQVKDLYSGTTGDTIAIAGGGTGAGTLAGASIVTYTGTETLTNKTLTNPTVTNYVETLQAVGTVGSTSTLALTNGTVLTATLTASTACTFTMPTATAGKSFILILTFITFL